MQRCRDFDNTNLHVSKVFTRWTPWKGRSARLDNTGADRIKHNWPKCALSKAASMFYSAVTQVDLMFRMLSRKKRACQSMVKLENKMKYVPKMAKQDILDWLLLLHWARVQVTCFVWMITIFMYFLSKQAPIDLYFCCSCIFSLISKDKCKKKY